MRDGASLRHAGGMTTSSPSGTLEQLTIAANGLTFHALAQGPTDGPPLLLLHGFPECAEGWRRAMGPLAAEGYRVVVPDQRGYGATDKPTGAAAYRIDLLTRDVVAIADALGYQRFELVGHDWGGIVAWRVASDFADRVERLVIVNAPNLDIAAGHALRHPMQMLRSSYVAMFQLPWLPEVALSSMNYALLAAALQRSSLPGTFSDDAIGVYRIAWSRPGALTAMLAWYRALPLAPRRSPVRITVPVRILWGDRDTALDPSLAEASLALCDVGSVRHFPGATHWLHHERPAELHDDIVRFLAGS